MTGTILGLDFGEKRIGVAVSDEMGMIASPLKTLEFKSRDALLMELKKLVQEYGVRQIVAGLPKTTKNEMGRSARQVEGHVAWFKNKLPVEWVLRDERFSTQEAERVLLDADISGAKRRGVIDQIAAQRVLQSFLDHERLYKNMDGSL